MDCTPSMGHATHRDLPVDLSHEKGHESGGGSDERQHPCANLEPPAGKRNRNRADLEDGDEARDDEAAGDQVLPGGGRGFWGKYGAPQKVRKIMPGPGEPNGITGRHKAEGMREGGGAYWVAGGAP